VWLWCTGTLAEAEAARDAFRDRLQVMGVECLRTADAQQQQQQQEEEKEEGDGERALALHKQWAVELQGLTLEVEESSQEVAQVRAWCVCLCVHVNMHVC